MSFLLQILTSFRVKIIQCGKTINYRGFSTVFGINFLIFTYEGFQPKSTLAVTLTIFDFFSA